MGTEQLGERIREERLKLNLTQENLAEMVDVSTAYIGQIERGERNPTLPCLITIANCLKTGIDYLLKDSIEQPCQYLSNLWIQLTKDMSQDDMELLIEIAKSIANHRR